MTALVRAAASEEQVAALLREVVNERLLLPLILRLGSDHPELRASLIASQIVGLTTATHIIRLDPLTCAPAQLLATSLTPVFEHYLSGTLNCPNDLGRSKRTVVDGISHKANEVRRPNDARW